jgi:serine/threonine-protein kinase
VWYRTRRFLRRYWFPATGTALVIASLSTGLYVANRERAVAERRFGQLRQLSNRVIDLDRAIRMLPGSVEARQRLVSASLEYLEGLSREAGRNVDLAQEISDGYWRLARIQGVNSEFNLGNSEESEESLKKAEALIETVLASRPGDRNALFRAAVIAQDRMILADGEERHADTLFHAHRCVQRLEGFLSRNDPRDSVRLDGFLRGGDPRQAERIGVATVYINLALTRNNMHLYDEGANYARRGVELVQSIPSAWDTTSQGLGILANALRYQGDLEAALTAIRRARALAEHARYPNDTTRLFTLYAVMLREGRILGEAEAVNLNRGVEAIEVLQKAVDMADGAAGNDPRDSASRTRVGIAARELGDILRERDPRRALAVYDLGIRRLAEIPSSLKARRDRAQLLANSSYALRRLHRASEAKARIAAAFTILKKAEDHLAERIRLGSYEYFAVRALADDEADSGRPRRALEIYEELLRKVSASKPQPEASLADAVALSRVYTAIAALNRRAGNGHEAATFDSRRLHLWRAWDAKLPNNSFVRHELQGTDRPV